MLNLKPRSPLYSQAAARLLTVRSGEATAREDLLAAEEPLKISVTGGAPMFTIRTPGHDLELTAGWLLGEGEIEGSDDIVALHQLPGRPSALVV